MNSQRWNPDHYAAHGRFVSELGLPALELLNPQPGERILDLGCGDGALTERLTQMGCQVVGVDASAEQVQVAQNRGLDARVIDGQALTFESEFDAVFSNAALHWMKQPEAVISGIWTALKPNGRFVGEFGGHGNINAVVKALEATLALHGLDFETLNPWYFPTAKEYRQQLESQGFRIVTLELIPRPTPLMDEIDSWFELFLGSFTASLIDQERIQFLKTLKHALRPKLCDSQGNWTIDYVRLRFHVEKQG